MIIRLNMNLSPETKRNLAICLFFGSFVIVLLVFVGTIATGDNSPGNSLADKCPLVPLDNAGTITYTKSLISRWHWLYQTKDEQAYLTHQCPQGVVVFTLYYLHYAIYLYI